MRFRKETKEIERLLRPPTAVCSSDYTWHIPNKTALSLVTRGRAKVELVGVACRDLPGLESGEASGMLIFISRRDRVIWLSAVMWCWMLATVSQTMPPQSNKKWRRSTDNGRGLGIALHGDM